MLRCPVCGSRDVYQVAGGYLGQIYRCKSCGYRGSLIMECERPEDPGPGGDLRREDDPASHLSPMDQ